MAISPNFDAVLALVQQLAPADKLRLAATLTTEMQSQVDVIPTYPALAPDVQQMLVGMTIDDMVVAPSGTAEDARALLKSWADEDDEEDTESWDDVLRSLDANRFSTRQLFPDLGQP